MAAAAGGRSSSRRRRLHRDQLLLRLDDVGGNRQKGGDRAGGARGREFDGRLAADVCEIRRETRDANTPRNEKKTGHTLAEAINHA